MAVRIIFTEKPVMVQKEKTCMIAKGSAVFSAMPDTTVPTVGATMDDVERFKRDHQVPDGVLPTVTETEWDTIYTWVWWEATG